MPSLRCQCHGRGAALSYKTEQRAQHRRHVKPNLPRGKNRIRRQRTPFRPWPAILLHFHLSTRWLKHKALRPAPVGAAAVNAERGGDWEPRPLQIRRHRSRWQAAHPGTMRSCQPPLGITTSAAHGGESCPGPSPACTGSALFVRPASPPNVSVVLLERQDKDKTKAPMSPAAFLFAPIPTSPSRTWVPSQGVASCEGPLARCRPSEPV